MKAVGESFPKNRVSNEEIVAWHGKKDASWIDKHLGNVARHTLFDFRTNRLTTEQDEDDLAAEASTQALAAAGIDAAELDAIIFVSASPTHNVFPDSACTLHRALCASDGTGALTITSGCAGTMNGLMFGSSMVQSGQAENVLVCAASSLSAYINPHLKEEMWLFASIFGDGASAILLGRDDSGEESVEKMRRGFSSFFVGADPQNDVAWKNFGGTKHPIRPEFMNEAMTDYLNIDYRAVPDNLRRYFTRMYCELREAHDFSAEDIDWILFNMSNARVQMRWVEEMNISKEKCYFNQEKVANCGPASLGMVLNGFYRDKKPKRGDLGLIMSVGTGLQYGGCFYRF